MTIQAVCECGFHREVPDKWLGMRVKCKCGRSFVISSQGSVAEPPIAEPPPGTQQLPANEPPVAQRPPQRADAEPSHSSESVAARYRARHNAAELRKRLVLVGGVGIALVCIGALAVALKDQMHSGNSGSRPIQAAAKKKPSSPSPTAPGKTTLNSTAGNTTGAAGGGRNDIPSLDNRMDGPVELEADDGLLLTGQFGDQVASLELTEEQSAQTADLAEQFRGKAEELKAGEIDLPQWYIEGGKIGNELLALLTDPQRDRLRQMVEAGEMDRVRLEEIAARLRPELETPSVSWRVDADGLDLPAVRQGHLALPAGERFVYTTRASGAFGVVTGAEDKWSMTIWDLLGDKRLGSLEVPAGEFNDTTLLADSGRLVVRGRMDELGRYEVLAWSLDDPENRRTRQLPIESGATSYQLVDCVANRVLCVCEEGFWVWNLDTDESHEARFSEWVPREVPRCGVSAGGRYVAMAHRHHPTIESKEYHFLEIGLYDVDTGDLLGNQVVATDYRPMSVAAIAFSYNGRELALLWDVDPPEPQRLLVQLSAVNGRVIRVASGLPTAETSYARRMNLPQRELIWLPDNTGWIVGLRGVADTESEAVVDIDLPVVPNGTGDEQTLPNIVDALPAGNHRLLILEPMPDANDPGSTTIRGRLIELPELGPFM